MSHKAEHSAGEDLLSCWQRQPPDADALHAIQRIFMALKKSCISHGDLKATNILVADTQYQLIDFDGSRELTNKAALEKATQQDIQRFLRNWESSEWISKLTSALQP